MNVPSSDVYFEKGGISVDDRGSVTFVNNFSFDWVSRFYIVENHLPRFIRAWHGHKSEAKGICCLSGSALVGAVRIDNWEQPSKDVPVEKHVLTESNPGVLCIPPGYANGIMTLKPRTKLLVFSSSTLEDSVKDDFRFPSRHWDVWEVEER